MPANMMIEPAGSSLKVIGRSSATVSAGPMPGRTPTAVPRSTPITANSRFIGWIAIVSPCARAASVSTMRPSEQVFDRAGGKAERQELGEHEIGHEGEQHADREVGQRR